MSWVPRRGRPVAIPRDATALRGSTIDARARIAWLLRVNRLQAAPGPATRFVEMLAVQGCQLSPSTLCRYETGAEAVPPTVVRAYERALGLPEGHLFGVVAGLDRCFGPVLAPDVMGENPTRIELSRALGEWEARIRDRSMRGTDWNRAAELLTDPCGPVLPPSVLRGWLEQLVAETMRSARHALTTRLHAIAVLLMDRGIGPVATDVVEELTGELGAQAITQVLSVIGHSPDPEVQRRLIQRFARSEGEQQWGAAHGLMLQVCTGTLDGSLVPLLTEAVRAAAADGIERGGPAFMLAQRMSAQLTREVVASIGCYPAPTMNGARVQSPAALSTYRAAALRESGLDDPMLDRLVRESLSPDFVERQHHSSLLLAATPYRGALAEVAARQVGAPSEPYADRAATSMLRYLAHPGQQSELLDLLNLTGDHQAPVLEALARSGGGVPTGVDLATLAQDPRLTSHVVYAAGMGGHPDLLKIAADGARLGTEAQRGALWWCRHGAAVTDQPTTTADRLLAG